MNQINLIGRITKDVEVKTTNGGYNLGKFTLAVPRKKNSKGETEIDFFDCTIFGAGADVIQKYCGKGSLIFVSGRMERNKLNTTDGKTMIFYNVLVEKFEFLNLKDREGASAEPTPYDMVRPKEEEELPF